MNSRLRRVLAESHVAAVAIAVLLFSSLDSAFWALGGPVSVAITSAGLALDIRSFFSALASSNRISLFSALVYLFNSLVCLAVATILSDWVYGVGPFRALSKYRTHLIRRYHA